MKIEIDDDLPNTERKHLLKYLPVKYALEKFKGNKLKAAEWLGYSYRGFREIIMASDTTLKESEKIKKYNVLKDKVEQILEKDVDIFDTMFYRYSEKEKKEMIKKIVADLMYNKVGQAN